MRSIFPAFLLAVMAMAAKAQNPVIRDQYTADPTARVFNNKVYLYPSHDILPPAGQRWTITPVTEAGGYLGGQYFRIVIEGTERALAATANLEVTTVPAFTGSSEQLWRIEQLTDGTYRIMPKAVPGQEGLNTRLVLYSIADSTPTLAPYDFGTDNSKWNFRSR